MNINKLLHGPNVAGQSLVDRVMAAKHSLTGEGLAKTVCKATTEEISPPKKKHIDCEYRVTMVLAAVATGAIQNDRGARAISFKLLSVFPQYFPEFRELKNLHRLRFQNILYI